MRQGSRSHISRKLCGEGEPGPGAAPNRERGAREVLFCLFAFLKSKMGETMRARGVNQWVDVKPGQRGIGSPGESQRVPRPRTQDEAASGTWAVNC